MKDEDMLDGTTPSVQTIHDSERAYFDQKADHDARSFAEDEWLVDPEVYPSTLKLWGFEAGLRGKEVLECGCGSGFFSVLLAKMGAQVWCFDISPKSVELTRERADLNGVADKVRPKVAAFENLDYEDERFDLVVGKNILHHIHDIEEAGRQIRRVLKKGGRAIFYELSAANPILMFFRRNVIGRSELAPKLGTPDEHPITADEVEILSALFDHQCRISHPKFRFWGKFDRQVLRQRYRPITILLEGMDKMIYTLFPPLRKYSYKILLEFTK